MSNWYPADSVPYATAYAEGAHVGRFDGGETVPYFGTVPYKPPKTRDPRKCRGNDNTCEAYASAGTKFCVGHRKAIAKEAAGGSEDES